MDGILQDQDKESILDHINIISKDKFGSACLDRLEIINIGVVNDILKILVLFKFNLLLWTNPLSVSHYFQWASTMCLIISIWDTQSPTWRGKSVTTDRGVKKEQ